MSNQPQDADQQSEAEEIQDWGDGFDEFDEADPINQAEDLSDQTPQSALRKEYERARDDGAIEEWAEEQLIAALPLEEFFGSQKREDEFIDLLTDTVRENGGSLIDLLESRLFSGL